MSGEHPEFGRQCEVSCGQCCEFWKDVFPEVEGIECPHLTPDGCEFKYEDRPDQCREYLCELGEAVANKIVTLERASVICENCLQFDWEKWGQCAP